MRCRDIRNRMQSIRMKLLYPVLFSSKIHKFRFIGEGVLEFNYAPSMKT
jgi:hypothetical protein